MSSCSGCDPEPVRSRSHPAVRSAIGRRLVAALFVVASLLTSLACADRAVDPPREPTGPVVLVTVSMLRPADVEAMPTLRGLAEVGDWSGSAVVPSSSPVVAAASLLTGVDPWIHGLLAFDEARPRLGAPTFAEALGEETRCPRGAFTEAHVPGDLGFGPYGLFAGLDVVRAFDLETVEAVLERVDDAPRFLWIHLPEPSFPLTASSAAAAASESIPYAALFAAGDPAIEIDPDLREAADRLMRHEAAAADRMLARLLAALERSGWRRDATIAFTALHGLELGEHGQSLFGWNLGRAVLEVPLVVDLPGDRAIEALSPPALSPRAQSPRAQSPRAQSPRAQSPRAQSPVAQQRLWPTLVEAAGGTPAPVHRPSLLHRDDAPIVSSLYARNGVNLFSAVERADGEVVQLTRTARFAPPEPEYWLAVRARAGERLRLSTSPRRLFGRLQRAFRATPPFDGAAESGDQPVERLERWTQEGRVEPLDDPARLRRLSRLLRERWVATAAPDATPESARRLSERP